MSHWYVERKWTCSSCETVNRGRDIRCSQCGSPKEKHEAKKERAGNPSERITDPELVKLAQQAPHWTCEYCGSNQRAPDGNCTSCGGAQKGTPTQKTSGRPKIEYVDVSEMSPKEALKAVERTRSRQKSRYDPPKVDERTYPLGRIPEPERSFYWQVPLGIAVLLGIGALLVWLFTPHELEAEITGQKWIHMVKYEERLTRHDEGWDAPWGAFNKSCDRRFRKYEDCNPYKCNPRQVSYDCRPHDCNCRDVCVDQGNGFDKCSRRCSTCYDRCTKTEYATCYERCRVYDDWCHYDYYEWVSRGERTLDGNSNQGLRWPDSGPQDATHRSKRIPAYIVHFRKGTDTFSWAPNTEPDFVQFSVGQRWKCEKAPIGLFKPLSKLAD